VGHYKKFIKGNGGGSNAYTSMTNTVYYYHIRNQSFLEALDIFSRFFIDPLLDPKYVDKEKNAVDSEFSKNKFNDIWRAQNLFRKTSSPDSLFNLFSTGNLETFDHPNIRDIVKDFYDQHYR
jgi:secreted Zn-dependent insulinase-like peptidase